MASSDPKGGAGPGSTLMCDLVASCLPYAREAPLSRLLTGSWRWEDTLLRPVSRYVSETVCADWGNSLHGYGHLASRRSRR